MHETDKHISTTMALERSLSVFIRVAIN